MSILPGIKNHSSHCEVDARFATAESLWAARSYASELCGAEQWFDDQVLLICLRAQGDSHCAGGRHGFARALERGDGLSQGLEQEARQ